MFYRLDRVRQRHEYDTRRLAAQPGETPSNCVCLYSDYAYIDRISKSFKLGKVNRIVLAGQHGRKDYILPVEYNHVKKASLSVIISPYELVTTPEEDEDATQKYTEGSGVITIAFVDIFTHVNLSWNGQYFCLPSEEVEVLRNKTDGLVRSSATRRAQPARRDQQDRRHDWEQEAFDGTVRVTICPEDGPEDSSTSSLRQSRRTRTAIEYVTY